MKNVFLLCVGLVLARNGLAQNGAGVLSVTAPAMVAPGASFSATIVMTNTGANAWTPGGAPGPGVYSLGSESPRNNARWLAGGRISLPADPVNPGDTATFTTTFTAPTAPGVYTFSWSMVQDSVEWFGEIASTTIIVGNGRFIPGSLVVNQMVPTAVDPAGSGVTPAFNTAGTAQALKNISLPSGATSFEVDLPTTGPRAMVSGANPFTGMLDLSTDKNYLIIGGYNTNSPYRPLGANVSVEAAGSPIPRVIGTVNSGGQYLLRASVTPPTGFTGGTFRGVVSDGLNNFWGGAQNSGIYYFGNTASAGQIDPAGAGAIRNMQMVNGRPAFTTSQFPVANNFGVVLFNSVAPKTPETPVLVIDSGNAVTGGTGTANPKGFYIKSDFTIAYVVDLRNAATGGGIYRYNGTGTGAAGSWTYQYTLTNQLYPNGGAFQDVIADFSGANPKLYATASHIATGNAAGSNVVTAVDTGPATTTWSVLAVADVGTTFRGLTFAPNPVSLSVSKLGTDVVVNWNGGGTLLSASVVTGPYVPVGGSPTSPYTNASPTGMTFYAVGNP